MHDRLFVKHTIMHTHIILAAMHFFFFAIYVSALASFTKRSSFWGCCCSYSIRNFNHCRVYEKRRNIDDFGIFLTTPRPCFPLRLQGPIENRVFRERRGGGALIQFIPQSVLLNLSAQHSTA